jgi:ABC-type Na+ efflux pump permease subunit
MRWITSPWAAATWVVLALVSYPVTFVLLFVAAQDEPPGWGGPVFSTCLAVSAVASLLALISLVAAVARFLDRRRVDQP